MLGADWEATKARLSDNGTSEIWALTCSDNRTEDGQDRTAVSLMARSQISEGLPCVHRHMWSPARSTLKGGAA